MAAISCCKTDYQELNCTTRASIKNVLGKNNLKFEKGRAFYQLMKPEIIQDYKEVIVRRKIDGNLISGEKVRDLLEIPLTNPKKFKFDVSTVPDFDVFIQSTSHNRVCMPGTLLLYKITGLDEGDEATVTEVSVAPKSSGVKTTVPPAPEVSGKITRKRKCMEEISEKIADKVTKRGKKGTPLKAAKASAVPEPVTTSETAKKPAKNSLVTEPVKTTETAEKPAETKGNAPKPAPKKSNGGEKVEVVFSFDTTGSMYACLAEVRTGIKIAIRRLKQEVPGIRIGVIAHGDYCDKHSTYVTKIKELTDNEAELCTFVETVGSTGGGDADECYELVLREARTKLSWTKDSAKSVVMIGDCNPHEPNYALNRENINWRDECVELKKAGIRVYAVQALNRSESTHFYRTLAAMTDGFHLRLDQFSSIVNFMMAICFREGGGDTLDIFEDEVLTGSNSRNRELHRLFDTLQGRPSSDSTDYRADGLIPVSPSRFQVLSVATRCSIKDFVQRNSLIFKTGRGFYEFTKPEKISEKKTVVLVDKSTGDMFTGQEAFNMIGAGGSSKVKPAVLDQWRVFVQSTSYNRILVGGTGFLYEVDPDF